MYTALCFVAFGLLPAAAVQGERLEPEQLVNEAWKFLPAYDGEHRFFLSEDEQRLTSSAAHLAEAAGAIDPEHLRALWTAGHAHALLAENAKNRGLTNQARRHYEDSVHALSRAIEIDANDPWARYARGAVYTSADQHALALTDLDRSVSSADRQLAHGGDQSSVAWLRFKALEWRAEVLMRLGEHERARAALREYHSEFSSNDWPMFIALAESHLRERDFAGARETYAQAIDLFPADHQAYALTGYVAGLVGSRELAASRLTEALEHELVPGMYTRLWLWILADGERRTAAREDLAAMVENPPDTLSAWDLRLGKFALGDGPVDAFLDAARAEERARMDAAQPLDDLMCEAWFYAGLRLEHDAARAGDSQAGSELRAKALEAYREALTFEPPKWKWEWAYARLHYADLARAMKRSASPGFVVDGTTITIGDLSGEVDELIWHAPRAERPSTDIGRALEAGDLLLCRMRTEEGGTQLVRLVVTAD